ncbi:hypothetical protein [Spiroplasma endosymbiont of Nephrotoma flavescens]|uniref:hypothetical protein n=1 Tax=Spiroplasma endosymbiont of Nephrotoma flavescens TaxID=3066302 RepID=UPI00313DC50F
MQKENKILLPVINKIYKEDYKNYRECAKKTLLLRKENHPLIIKYNKELTYFFDLPENDFLEKNNSSGLLNNNELQTINSESVLDGIETGYHAKQYFIRNYNCFDFDDYDRHLGANV